MTSEFLQASEINRMILTMNEVRVKVLSPDYKIFGGSFRKSFVTTECFYSLEDALRLAIPDNVGQGCISMFVTRPGSLQVYCYLLSKKEGRFLFADSHPMNPLKNNAYVAEYTTLDSLIEHIRAHLPVRDDGAESIFSADTSTFRFLNSIRSTWN